LELTAGLFVAVAVVSALFHYLSVSFGLGYGTAVTPVLLVMGFLPLQAVPAVLMAQLSGGLVGSLAHHRLGNVALATERPGNPGSGRLRVSNILGSVDSRVILMLAACGTVGVLAGVVAAVNLPLVVQEIYIGVLVLGVGGNVLVYRARDGRFSWTRLTAFGLVAAFNKGVSGGGYVPLIAGGQIVSGRTARSAVATTTLSVSLVCLVGFLSYLFIEGDIYWRLAIAAVIGSVLSAPFAAMTVRRMKGESLRLVIGLATTGLGIAVLVKALV
jgi:uncharacterized membrane protein YfcA